MITGVGEPVLIVRNDSCSIELGLGDGDWPSTWKPTICCCGTLCPSEGRAGLMADINQLQAISRYWSPAPAATSSRKVCAADQVSCVSWPTLILAGVGSSCNRTLGVLCSNRHNCVASGCWQYCTGRVRTTLRFTTVQKKSAR